MSQRRSRTPKSKLIALPDDEEPNPLGRGTGALFLTSEMLVRGRAADTGNRQRTGENALSIPPAAKYEHPKGRPVKLRNRALLGHFVALPGRQGGHGASGRIGPSGASSANAANPRGTGSSGTNMPS